MSEIIVKEAITSNLSSFSSLSFSASSLPPQATSIMLMILINTPNVIRFVIFSLLLFLFLSNYYVVILYVLAFYLSASISKQLRARSEEHTSELQSRFDLVCRLLLEKKKECQFVTSEPSRSYTT